jgi:outer membrane protein assembly factor BamD
MKDYPTKQVAPEALYYLAMTYQELGANDWATEKLQLLVDKYPNSDFSGNGRRLLAKLEKKPSSSQSAATATAKADAPASNSQPETTLLAAKAPASNIPSIAASTDQRQSNPAGLSLRQPFVSCRLGAWC